MTNKQILDTLKLCYLEYEETKKKGQKYTYGICSIFNKNAKIVLGDESPYYTYDISKYIKDFKRVCEKFGGDTNDGWYWTLTYGYGESPFEPRLQVVDYLIKRYSKKVSKKPNWFKNLLKKIF